MLQPSCLRSLLKLFPPPRIPLASFLLHFEIPSDLPGPATFSPLPHLPSFSHPFCPPNQTTDSPRVPNLCLAPCWLCWEHSSDPDTARMELPGRWRIQTHHQAVTAQSAQGWDGGSPEGCGNLEKVTGQTWGIREGFLEEEEM